MAPIISFAWTSPALLAGEKTVTRRLWSPDYARRFREGMEVLAYDRNPRNGGKPIARLRLTADATFEPDADAPNSDYAAEGFAWLAEHYGAWLADGRDISWGGFARWRRAGGSSWVVRFALLETLVDPTPAGCAACGALRGAVGAWDVRGEWHVESEIDGLNSSVGEELFGDYPEMHTIRLRDGLCQRCWRIVHGDEVRAKEREERLRRKLKRTGQTVMELTR